MRYDSRFLGKGNTQSMEINKTNITNEMGSSTISVYTSNINIKYVNKLRLIRASRPNIY